MDIWALSCRYSTMALMRTQRCRDTRLHCTLLQNMVTWRLSRRSLSKEQVLEYRMRTAGHHLRWQRGLGSGRLCNYCRNVIYMRRVVSEMNVYGLKYTFSEVYG